MDEYLPFRHRVYLGKLNHVLFLPLFSLFPCILMHPIVLECLLSILLMISRSMSRLYMHIHILHLCVCRTFHRGSPGNYLFLEQNRRHTGQLLTIDLEGRTGWRHILFGIKSESWESKQWTTFEFVGTWKFRCKKSRYKKS